MDTESISTSSCPSLSGDEIEKQSTSEDVMKRSESPCLSTPTVLHWFRMNSLRMHDNPALHKAMTDPARRFRCVFVIDPWFAVGEKRFCVNRWKFLLECLHDIDKRLHSLNSRLYVAKGHPIAVLEKMCADWNVESITYQVDCDPRSTAEEQALDKLAQTLNIESHKFYSHTLYEPAKVIACNGNRPLTTFKDFKALLPLLGAPESPLNPTLADFGKLFVSDGDLSEDFSIPTLADLGFPNDLLYTSEWIGGETEALRKLPIYCQLRARAPTNPVDTLFDKSAMSPYIKYGCLSVRYFLWTVKWLAKNNPTLEVLAKDVYSKLLLREFYFTVALQIPNFDTSVNNPICIPYPWDNDYSAFRLWKEGKTGYPWIDAAMRQLNKEGWIHHHLRESAASFLTRGDLWVSWVWGKDVFEELLLDYEPSVSCGCWMRSSCCAFVTVPVEHYCPVTFGQKLDPEGIYIKTYVPELKGMPAEYIFSPWLAPLEVQQASRCVIGVDYPLPIVDHSTAGTLCCEKLKTILLSVQSLSAEPSRTAVH
eukprot:Em0021g248a